MSMRDWFERRRLTCGARANQRSQREMRCLGEVASPHLATSSQHGAMIQPPSS
jgi:hypothetical protein